MNKDFYKNCIIQDRKKRKFIDCSGEKWFQEFMNQKEQLYSLQYITRQKTFGMKTEYMEKFSQSKEILDLLSDIPIITLERFLYSYKLTEFDNIEEIDEKNFSKVNLPLIRMMDYFLEKGEFERFSLVMYKLEYRYIILWFELTEEKVNKIIEENIQNPELSYIFSGMDEEEYVRFSQKENAYIMKNSPFFVFESMYHRTAIPQNHIDNEFFLESFKKVKLYEQISVLEQMENMGYSFEFIRKLHKLLNKNGRLNQWEFHGNVFEISEPRIKKLFKEIENSSYYKKNNMPNLAGLSIAEFEKTIFIKTIEKSEKSIDLSDDYYSVIMDLYYKCREYATTSIVQSLYPLNAIFQKVTHIEDEHFNILVRTRTMWECKDLEETFNVRTLCSFSILTEENMLYYNNEVLYGYYTNVSPDLITRIYLWDSLRKAEAGRKPDWKTINMFLDIEDLNQITLRNKTYNQLYIRTKTNDGQILCPDCIICIDKIDEKSQSMADRFNLNILVIHKNKDTI